MTAFAPDGKTIVLRVQGSLIIIIEIKYWYRKLSRFQILYCING
jgi:hypothetical protein